MRRHIDITARGFLFLVTVAIALILGFATDLGHQIDLWQAGGPGGLYSPKLTFMVLLLISAAPTVLIYFVLKFLVIKRLPDR
jgi:hypothetical protein